MDIKLLDDQNYRVAIPIPFPMKYIYCYLLKNDNGYTLIDTGLNYKKAVEAWEEVFSALKIVPTEIHTIILTHFHPDHSGLSGWMQQRTGAKVYMSSTDLKMLQLAFGEGIIQERQIEELLVNHGVPTKLREEIKVNLENIKKNVQPIATIQPIKEKELLLDHRMWKVIETPGHSEGHLCFYQEQDKLLIAGDMVLDKITPNISLWPGGSKRPLNDYLESLEKLRMLPINEAWPGHGDVIYNVSQRIDEIIQHHKNRLQKISELVSNKSGFEITSKLFEERELNAHQWRFAIAETLAHLEYLVEDNKIKNAQSNPILYAR